MGSLFAALGTASGSLDVLQRAMGVVQNNVTNASTPGYVTQNLILNARPFDPAGNLWGGVQAGGVQSARDVFAEQAVWQANQQAGAASIQSSSLSLLQQQFDVSGKTGVPGALSALYSAFSAWSTSPTDTTARQQVITAAQGVAAAFNQTASGIGQIQSQADQQIANTVTQVNQLASQIATMNAAIRSGSKNDGGLDAQLYNTLEQLSNLAPVNVHNESDGTVTVLLGGQLPLVIGKTANSLQVSSTASGSSYPGAPGHAQISASDGQDATRLITQGQLGGLLQFRNGTIAGLTGDGGQQGSLNQLAQSIADQVNQLLESGQTSSGANGVPLFSYLSSPGSNQVGLAGNTLNLNISGATFVKGTSPANDQTFTFNVVDLATNQNKQITATVPASAGGVTLTQALTDINTALSGSGITASADASGHLQFTGATAFTLTDNNAGNTVPSGLTAYSGGSPINGTAENTSNFVADSPAYVPVNAGGTETLTFTPQAGAPITVTLNDTSTGDTLDHAIATINAATASSGIFAVKNSAGTGISFQSTNGFTVTDQVDAAAAGSGAFGTAGAAAITYYSQSPLSTSAAATLSVNSSITVGQLAAISSTSANGIADQLAQLATAQNSSLSNLSYTDYYAGMASAIGSQAANAATVQQTQTQALTQAQNMRAQVSGVSLNEQAAKLLQFQEAYQASAQMISVINTTMQYLLQMMQQVQ